MSRRLSELVQRDLEDDPLITAVTADSRKAGPGVLFAALKGVRSDGAQFIPEAVARGAAAVIAGMDAADCGAPLIRAQDPRRLYALASAALWSPQPHVCVAVTGTNGKTSVAGFCRQIFARAGLKAASMGTLGVRVEGPDGLDRQLTPPGLTTPDAADVARLAGELRALGVNHLAVEASSHGIDQRRLDGLRLRAAGFLNLTQDHLDYHGDMAAYQAAKLRLFEELLPTGAVAVLNADSDAYDAFAACVVERGQTLYSVGANGEAIRMASREPVAEGQRLQLVFEGRACEVLLPLAGAFQASNALVAAGLCRAAGVGIDQVLEGLAHLQGAAGRLQRVGRAASGGEAYIDYAHTPDGLQSVLSALRPHTRGRLIVVFGAGGDRDRTKRPLMGAVACAHADLVIVTDDNPRSEDPSSIRQAILEAAPGAREIGDRRLAIRAGVEALGVEDVLVVAGKGHEQGQIIGEATLPFDDFTEVAAALEASRG